MQSKLSVGPRSFKVERSAPSAPFCLPPSDSSPDTFAQLLAIAAKAGVTVFEAGPFKVTFGSGVHEEWRRLNRPVVDR
jgi:hypothetical protein